MKWTPKNLFTGRIKRIPFAIGSFFANSIFGLFLFYYYGNLRFDLYLYLWALFAICLFFLISLMVRRLHDIDKSGFWVFVFVLPILNILMIFFLLIYPGKEESNSYGSRMDRGVIKSIFNIK